MGLSVVLKLNFQTVEQKELIIELRQLNVLPVAIVILQLLRPEFI